MKRSFLATLFAIATFSAVVSGDPATPASAPPAPAVQQRQIKDPRASICPVILYHNQKEPADTMEGPLLIYARHDLNPPNQILGIDGSFTDDQIIAGLKKFYEQWRPAAGHRSDIRPQLILAQQNWGCGSRLYKPLEEISKKYEIDVYQLYPVLTQIEFTPGNPHPNDKRLSELIKEE